MLRSVRLPVTLAAALLAVVTGLSLLSAAGGPAAAAAGPRSAMGWPSGVYVPGDDVARYDAFGAWRGAPVDVAVTWTPRRSWADLTGSGWLFERWRGTSHTLAVGVPPIPQDGVSTLAACAAGAYDAQWRQFGAVVAAAGVQERTILRLGWEFNGDWYVWAARDPGTFAACWRRVHDAVESAAPGLRWDWSVNRGTSQLGIDARAAYPGDAYVDVVGVDSYDGWPGAVDAATWDRHHSGPFGLKFWADFARQHGKQLSVPEWGVYPGTAWAGHNGGDNPFYVARMFEFFTANRDILAYEAYFDEPAAYYAGALALNPRAANEYRARVAAALTVPAAPAPVPPTAAPPAVPPTAPPVQPTVQPTVQPPVQPTVQPTEPAPTEAPIVPTQAPPAPPAGPTTEPTGAPTAAPPAGPTAEPTAGPTAEPEPTTAPPAPGEPGEPVVRPRPPHDGGPHWFPPRLCRTSWLSIGRPSWAGCESPWWFPWRSFARAWG